MNDVCQKALLRTLAVLDQSVAEAEAELIRLTDVQALDAAHATLAVLYDVRSRIESRLSLYCSYKPNE